MTVKLDKMQLASDQSLGALWPLISESSERVSLTLRAPAPAPPAAAVADAPSRPYEMNRYFLRRLSSIAVGSSVIIHRPSVRRMIEAVEAITERRFKVYAKGRAQVVERVK